MCVTVAPRPDWSRQRQEQKDTTKRQTGNGANKTATKRRSPKLLHVPLTTTAEVSLRTLSDAQHQWQDRVRTLDAMSRKMMPCPDLRSLFLQYLLQNHRDVVINHLVYKGTMPTVTSVKYDVVEQGALPSCLQGNDAALPAHFPDMVPDMAPDEGYHPSLMSDEPKRFWGYC